MSYRTLPYAAGETPEEPLTVDEARAHCEATRYGDSDADPVDDAMFAAWITAAREYCEDFLGLALVPKQIEFALDAFPATLNRRQQPIEFPVAPVREVVSLGTGDPETTDHETVDENTYVLDVFSVPPALRSLGSWPSATASPNNVRVRAWVGYGVDSDGGEPVPKVILQAMKLMVGHFYANREDSIDVSLQSIPNGAMDLMRPRRIRKGFA